MFNKGDHVITPTGEHGRLIDLRVREEHGLTVTEASNGKG